MKKTSSKKIPLRVLYLEDSKKDIELIGDILSEVTDNLHMESTAAEKEFVSFLQNGNYDVILSDFKLPGFDAFGALALAKKICPDTPFICVSGSIGEEIAIELIKKGAVDYILKDRLVRLPIAIERAREEAEEKKSLKDAQEALLESEQRFQILAENSPVGIFETDAQGNTTYVNPQYCNISGLSSEEALGTGWLSAVHTADKPKLSKDWQKATAAAESSQSDYRFIRKDGTVIWVIGQAIPKRDQKNKVTGYVGTITDITDRKKSEDALITTSTFLESLLNAIPMPVFYKDKAGQYISVNKAFEVFYGKKQKEIIGKTVFDIAPRELAVVYHSKDLELLHNPGIQIYECEMMDHSGVLHDVIYNKASFTDKKGNADGIIGVILDISERKKAEAALRKSEEKYRSLIDNMEEGIFVSDKSNIIKFANKELARIHGFDSPQKMFNRKFIEFIEPIARERIEQLMGDNNAPPSVQEYSIVKPDGTLALVSVRPTLLFEGKQYAGTMGIVQDITERKKTEDALRVSEEKFRKAFMTSPDSININRLFDGMFVSANKGFSRLLGYEEEEILGKTSIELNIWDNPADRNNMVKGLKENGVVENLVARFRAKNGGIKYGMMSACIIQLDEIPHILNITRDITERMQTEEALKESEEKYRNLIDTMKEGIFILDEQGVVKFSNKEFANILGIDDPEQLLNKPLMGNLPSIGREMFIKKYGNDFQHGKFSNSYGQLVHKRDGTQVYVDILPTVMYKEGKPAGTMVIVQDVTERKRAEDALIESEKSYKDLINGMSETVWVIDFQGNLLDVNKTAVDTLGYSKAELLSMGLFGIDSSMKKEKIKTLAQKMPEDILQIFETTHRSRDGKIIPVEVYSSIVKYHGKQAILSIARDITERKNMEEQLRQMQKLQGLGTLAGGIAHDFNNILGIILAYTTSIKRFKGDINKLETAVDTISKAVNRGKTLVQQILTFARKTETTFGAVNINDLVMEIMTMILETFPKTLTYAQNFHKPMPFINADHSQLHQTLLNLCVNARDAMPKGGILTINTRIVPGEQLRSRHKDAVESAYACIEVVDTGDGMTQVTKERIFEPFFTTKGIGKGTGLGLAVVFGVIQTHKGFIDVESGIGKGTKFCLYFPVMYAERPVEKITEETMEEIKGGTETLLVVEDEEMLIASLQMVLAEKGYTVLCAQDGLSALKIYHERKDEIALVLTDYGLPAMTGLELCQRIKQVKSEAKIILATGYLEPETKTEFLKEGIRQFLFKPYDLIKVLKTVRDVLNGK